jgi:regulator of nucleoside diphosphate kinase
MEKIIVSKLDSARLMNLLGQARRDKIGHVSYAEKLLNELNNAKLYAPQKMPSNVVTMHSKVRIFLPTANQHREITLVYPDEANLKENKISIFAPIATALLGYKKGDTVTWTVPGGSMDIVIEDILFQPESAEQYDL